MKILISLSAILFVSCSLSPIAEPLSHPLEQRVYAEIDPNLPAKELTLASFQSPTLKLRDIEKTETHGAKKWEIQFQTHDFSDVFSLTVVEEEQKVSQLRLLNTHWFISHPESSNAESSLDLDPQRPQDIQKTLNMLKNLQKAVFDPNNMGDIAELIRLIESTME